MARDNGFISGVGIAVAAAALALSPRARRAVRAGVASAVSGASTVAKTAARGTRNLQEESKHVARFSANPGEDAPVNEAPPTDSSSP